MPPQVPSCCLPDSPLLYPLSPKSPSNLAPTREKSSMKLTRRKLILALVFILVCASLLRVLKIAISTLSLPLMEPSPALFLSISNQTPSPIQPIISSNPNPNTLLTKKELQFLSNIILQRSPCNLLVFGLEDQYLALPDINAGGNTIFLEDRPDKLSKIKGNLNSTRVSKVEYKTIAKEAYRLLKHARTDPSCSVHAGIKKISSKCKLALTKLPKEVLKTKWDVIVVDGPDGHGPDTPGRMATIYMAGVLARTGNGTNVVVHDIDRMVEKWFSWEFLCDRNLVSSKGRFWNFRIARQKKTNSTAFCDV